MKFSTILSTLVLAATSFAQSESDKTQIPSEAVIGYLDLGANRDIALLPFGNSTSNGILFVNTTIAKLAASEEGSDLAKREAVAEAWHWLELDRTQPMYKRDAVAEAWHWLELDRTQPMYKREADAEAWHWLELDRTQPMY